MSSPKTVLVVDDSLLTLMTIKAIIQTHYPGWRVLEARNGHEALAVCEGQQIDIVTVDMNMPGMDGVTLGLEMRRRYPDAEISVLTARVQHAARERARDAQMIFVPKPVTEERILVYLRSLG